MRNEITGGMSEQEVREMLLKRGVRAFMAIAGSLPQKCENGVNYPEFTLNHNWYGGAYPTTEAELWGDDRMGEVIGVHIQASMNWCFMCSWEFRQTVNHDTLSIHFPHNSVYPCDLCGVMFDDIPF